MTAPQTSRSTEAAWNPPTSSSAGTGVGRDDSREAVARPANPCQWAMCTAPAVKKDDDGYWHCGLHWQMHVEFLRDPSSDDHKHPHDCTRNTAQRVVAMYREWKMTGSQIAAELGVSRSTVNKHLRNAGIRQARGVPTCGTYSGYQKHHRDKTEPCEPCRDARRVVQAAYDAKRREQKREYDRQRDQQAKYAQSAQATYGKRRRAAA